MKFGKLEIPSKNKYYLLVASTLMLGFLIYKIKDPKIRGPIHMKILKNENAATIRAKGQPKNTLYVDYQDRLWFQSFKNSAGNLEVEDINGANYQSLEQVIIDFAVDFEMRGSTDKEIFFKVVVDDEFILMIDEKELISFESPTEKKTVEGSLKLAAGVHTLQLRYLQHFGGMAIQAFYKILPSDDWQIIGADSQEVLFHKPKKTDFNIVELKNTPEIIYSPNITNEQKTDTDQSSPTERIFFPNK